MAETGGLQCLDKGSDGRYVSLTEVTAQLVLDVDGTEEVVFGRGGRLVVGQQDGLGRRLTLEVAVVLLDGGFLLTGEVPRVAVVQLIKCLGVHLLVGNRLSGVDDAGEFAAQVAARPRGVGERLAVVGGGNERSHARQHDVLVAAHLTRLDVALGKHPLDFSLLAVGLGVVLVDVDQQHASEHTLHLFGRIQFDVVDVVFAQRGRQYEFAEGALVRALPADEHGYEAVAVVAAALLPLGHHGEEPAVEEVGPLGVGGRYAACKLADVVGLAVPLTAAAEVVGDGVVVGCQCRAHIKLDIHRPGHADLQHLLEGYAAQMPVGHLLPSFMLTLIMEMLMLTSKILTIRIFFLTISIFLFSLIAVTRPKLLLLFDDVVTQFVVAVEKRLDSTGYTLLVGCRQRACLTTDNATALKQADETI